jgi:hypothetical protein
LLYLGVYVLDNPGYGEMIERDLGENVQTLKGDAAAPGEAEQPVERRQTSEAGKQSGKKSGKKSRRWKKRSGRRDKLV